MALYLIQNGAAVYVTKFWLVVLSFGLLDVAVIAVGYYLLLPKCGFNG